jgi:anti-sigma factor RsiW
MGHSYMDHGYIDEHSVAVRYLDQGLSTEERAEFEAHLVDCQECTDRVLLAEMFHSRNGHSKLKAAEVLFPPKLVAPGPILKPGLRVRCVLLLRPWQVVLVLAGAAVLLVLTPSVLIWLTRR